MDMVIRMYRLAWPGMPIIKWFLRSSLDSAGFPLDCCLGVYNYCLVCNINYRAVSERAIRFVVGVLRWGLSVEAYAIILITDKYPPFSTSALATLVPGMYRLAQV